MNYALASLKPNIGTIASLEASRRVEDERNRYEARGRELESELNALREELASERTRLSEERNQLEARLAGGNEALRRGRRVRGQPSSSGLKRPNSARS